MPEHLPKHPIDELMAQERAEHHHHRRASHLYNESWQHQQLADVSAVVDTKRTMLRHSRKPSPRLLATLSFIFGTSYPRPLSATIFATFTFSMALLYAITSGFYIYYDVVSDNTTSTIFTGSADAVLGLAWTTIGVYGNDLGRRIVGNPALLNNVRLHSRTVLRVNAAAATIVLSLTALVIHIYMERGSFLSERCELVNLHSLVCKLRYVSNAVHSSLVVFWNSIVVCLVMSMCRTFTIVCRRFIRELEHEGKILEKIYRLRMEDRTKNIDITAPREVTSAGAPRQSFWDSDTSTPGMAPSAYMHSVESDFSEEDEAAMAERLHRRAQEENVILPSNHSPLVGAEGPANDISVNPSMASDQELHTITNSVPSSHEDSSAISEITAPQARSRRKGRSRTMEGTQRHVSLIARLEGLLFTEEDLCMRFWKVNCQLRITSMVFQRWFATWLAFVGFWAFSYIVYWLKHNATLLEFAYFFLPIIIVAMVCAVYAEVNLESSRIIYSLCPRAGRLPFNRFLNGQPAYLMVYAMPMTYQVITGIVFAFTVAFASRIIMDELKG